MSRFTPLGTSIDRLATGESGVYYGLSAAVAAYHEHYGCIICGSHGPDCTSTLCRTALVADPELQRLYYCGARPPGGSGAFGCTRLAGHDGPHEIGRVPS